MGENRLGAPPSQLHIFVVCGAQRGGQRSNKFTGTPGLSHVNAAGTAQGNAPGLLERQAPFVKASHSRIFDGRNGPAEGERWVGGVEGVRRRT